MGLIDIYLVATQSGDILRYNELAHDRDGNGESLGNMRDWLSAKRRRKCKN